MTISIVGGGAAGCFCAVEAARLHPDAEVVIYEAGNRLMAKLARTGGGRCNITNTFAGVDDLRTVYPRGFRLMERALAAFSPEDTAAWWTSHGVGLYAEPDGRCFPVSNDALQVVACLERLIAERGVRVVKGARITSLNELATGVRVVTTGGGLPLLLRGTAVRTVPTVPSLFALKTGSEQIRALSGNVVKGVSLTLTVHGPDGKSRGEAATKVRSEGDILLTDWGFSGPAVLRLSSYAARELAASGYRGTLLVNWLGCDEEEARQTVCRLFGRAGGKMVANVRPEGLCARVWSHILRRASVREDMRCSEAGSKTANRIVAALTADCYELTGRAAFREEFVRCGGVASSAVHPATFESRDVAGLHFAGEVLDIDGVTGGFNLQAAWSTAMCVARGMMPGK